MKLLADEQLKARYYHYLDMLCNQYILGGEFAKTSHPTFIAVESDMQLGARWNEYTQKLMHGKR